MALPHRAACMGGLLALTLQLQAPSPLLVLIDRAQRRQALPLMRTDLVTSTTIHHPLERGAAGRTPIASRTRTFRPCPGDAFCAGR